MKKLLSLILSVCLLLNMVAPSFAQVVTSRASSYTATQLATNIHRQLDLNGVNRSEDPEVLRQSRNMAAVRGWVFSAQQEATLDKINELLGNKQISAQEDVCAITRTDFEKEYRAAVKPEVEEILKAEKDEVVRGVLSGLIEQEIEGRVGEAYEYFKVQCPKMRLEAQEGYLKQLSEEASGFTRVVTMYQRVGETMPRKSVEPINEYLAWVYSGYGEKVVSKGMRERASKELRGRVKEYSERCVRGGKEEDCKVYVGSLYALGVLGVSQADVEVLADELVKNYAIEGGLGVAVISTVGSALLGMKDVDKDYKGLMSALGRIIAKGDEPGYWEVSPLKIANWVEVAEEVAEGARAFTSKGYRASLYKDDTIKAPQTGQVYDSAMSAWIDLGALIGEESKKDSVLKGQLDRLVSQSGVVNYYEGSGVPYVQTRHNLLLTGLLYGGYEVNVQAKDGGRYLDTDGKVRTEKGNGSAVRAMKEALSKKGLSESEFVAYNLYQGGYRDLEPGTSRLIKNYLAVSVRESVAERLQMEALAHPTSAEVALYNKYQPAKEIAAGTDVVVGFVAEFAATWVLLDGIIYAAVKGVSYGLNLGRAVRLATVMARGGRGMKVGQAGRLSEIASRISFGANTPLKAFLNGVRAGRGSNYAVVTELANGERIVAGQFGLPEGAQLVKAARKAVKSPAKSGLTAQTVDGTVYMVPEGLRLVRVGNQVTYAGKGRSIGELSEVFNAEVREVYASAGEGFANAGKVQPVMAQAEAAQTVGQSATEAVVRAPKYQFNPDYVNQLGQRTGAWEPLSLSVPGTGAAPVIEGSLWQRMGWKAADSWREFVASGKRFLISADLWWNLSVRPMMSGMWRFGTTRYGLAGITAGGAPVTVTAAEGSLLAGAETVTEQVVSNYAWLNQARLGWVSAEEMFGVGSTGVKVANQAMRSMPRVTELANGQLAFAENFSRYAAALLAAPFSVANSLQGYMLTGVDYTTGGLQFSVVPVEQAQVVPMQQAQTAQSGSYGAGVVASTWLPLPRSVMNWLTGQRNETNASEDFDRSSFPVMLMQENGESTALPIAFSIGKSLSSKGYDHVVFHEDSRFENGYIVEMHDHGKAPIQMNHFYMALYRNDVGALIKAAQKAGVFLRLKLDHRANVSYETISKKVYDETTGEELPVEAFVQLSKPLWGRELNMAFSHWLETFGLSGGYTTPVLINAKLVLRENGEIWMQREGSSSLEPLPDEYYVRLPKNQIRNLVALTPYVEDGKTFDIVLSPTSNRVNMVARDASLTNVSLGKTMGSVVNGSLGMAESDAKSLMFSINYVLPGFASLLTPILKKYGEKNLLSLSLAMSVASGVLATAGGFYGFVEQMVLGPVQKGLFIAALFLMSGSSIIKQLVTNMLIRANRGEVTLSDSGKQKAADEKGTEAKTEGLDLILKRAKEFFTKKSSVSFRTIADYNMGFVWKNVGTLAFLGSPYLISHGIQAVSGVDLGLDYSISFPLYAVYSSYVMWKVLRSKLRDAYTAKNLLQSQQMITNMLETGSAILAQDNVSSAVIDDVARSFKDSLDALAFAHIKLDPSKKKKLLYADAKEQVLADLEVNLIKKYQLSDEHAKKLVSRVAASIKVQENNLGNMWKMMKAPGVPALTAAMTLATVHEFVISSSFSGTMKGLISQGEFANFLIASSLYIPFIIGRLGGNWVSKRISPDTMYIFCSVLSALGTAIMATAGDSVGQTISGAVVASLGVGNFFTQMYDYIMTKYPKQNREISSILALTMGVAGLGAIPAGYVAGEMGFGLPLDLMYASVALAASLVLTPGMMVNSSLFKGTAQEVKNRWEKLKKMFDSNKTPQGGEPLTPAEAQ